MKAALVSSIESIHWISSKQRHGPEALDLERTLSRKVATVTTFLTVRETAELLGVSAHTLRYYEREGLVTVPRQGSERLYGPAELDRLRFLLVLRGTGMGMAGLREYIALAEQGQATVAQRRKLLVTHEQSVLAQQRQLEEHLQAIGHKIHRYDTECDCGPGQKARR